MRTIETTFGQIFDVISALEGHDFIADQEFLQQTPIQIQNENNQWHDVNGLITKEDGIVCTLTWSDGSFTKCAAHHWIRVSSDTVCKLARDFQPGDEITRADGATLVCMSNDHIEQQTTFYDLQIDTDTHLYQTADGVVHHNSLLVHSIARMLDVPIISYDATSLTEAGYIGADVEDIIARLLQAADFDIRKCERGIIFLDECDKKTKKDSGSISNRDVTGEGVQQALLKLLEGTDIMIPATGRRGPNAELVRINTRNILFILGGAFTGLEKIIAKTADGTACIGFGAKVDATPQSTADLLRMVEPEHLVKYGLIPELVGRVPIVSVLDDLSEDQLMRILTEPKNALVKQYTKMFALDGVILGFDDDALRAVAKLAKTRKTNGRALRGVLEHRLLHTQFNLPDLHEDGAEKIIVHLETIIGGIEPEVVYRKRKPSLVAPALAATA